MNRGFFISCSSRNPIKIPLHAPLRLHNHEVCVSFISIPTEFQNVPKSNMELRLDGEKSDKMIPAGYYGNAADLVNAINAEIGSSKIEIEYIKASAIAEISIKDSRNSIKFSPAIANLLQLPTGTIKNYTRSTASIVFSGDDATFYIETNFTIPQLSNSQMVPLLCLAKAGSYTDNYDAYVDVKPGIYTNLLINVTSSKRIPINFITSEIYITLHFRKKEL